MDTFWADVDHKDPEQLKRQESACSKKLTPISIDEELQIGVFEGSSKDYTVTLDKCQCADFGRRKLPCKHIYRLAHELGVFDLGIGTQTKVSVGLLKRDVPYTVDQIIEKVPEGEAIALIDFLKTNWNECRINPDVPIKTLLELEIFKEAVDTPESVIRFYLIDEIKEMLKSRDLPVPKARTWDKITPIAIEQVGDLMLLDLPKKTSSKLYKFNPVFEPIRASLLTQLKKTYPLRNPVPDPETGIYKEGGYIGNGIF